MKTLFSFINLLVFTSLFYTPSANAGFLRRDINQDCPTVGFVEYWRDDNTGTIWIHERFCNYTDCWEPQSNMPDPFWNPVTPITPFGSSVFSCSMASNTLTGRGFVDAMGDTIKFRTPVDTDELNYIIYLESQQGSIIKAPESNNNTDIPAFVDENSQKIHNYFERKKEANKSKLPDFDAIMEVTKLFDQRVNMDITSNEYLHARNTFMGKITKKGNESNMVIVQTPQHSNGYMVIIKPVDPLVYSSVKVMNSNGETVWQGEVKESTNINISEFSSGVYFIQGVGRTLQIAVTE
jgi:hypothetical protein